ncbi:MAG: COX15/CtaA family protein [bacterium]
MTRRYAVLAWTAAACTYLLIVLGAVVRITGSGMGCGDHWPLCNGRLFPPLDDLGTAIEWSHRLLASVVSVLVAAVALVAWRERRPGATPYVALGIVGAQVLLGGVTVKTGLTPLMVILHLATAMVLLATLLMAAGPRREGARSAVPLLALAFVTILFGALVANLGAASACLGFPLCNGQLLPTGNYLQHLHWTHRLLAYALTASVIVWTVRTPGRGPKAVLGLVLLQVTVGAAAVLLGLPGGLQAAHVAVGAGVWAGLVLAVR